MKYNNKFKTLFFIGATFVACKTNKPIQIDDQLQSKLDSIVSLQPITGATMSVLANGKYIRLASGYADVENKFAMKPDDIMFSGSIGKNFVAAVILNLEEKGQLSFDDPVKKFFESDNWYDSLPNANQLTIRMLLNHTSGLPRYVFDLQLWQTLKDHPEKVWTGVERLRYIFGKPEVHQAGAGWAYSDTNYILLGMIIEKLTGRNYYDLVSEQILQPLQLSNTSPSTKQYIAGLIPGYTSHQELFLPRKVTENNRYAINPQFEWTGGGIATTSSDLATWARALYAGNFFKKHQVEYLTTAAPFETSLKDAQYGFATIIWKYDNQPVYGHTGLMPGYISLMQYYPESDVALAMQLNCDKLPEGLTLTDIAFEIYSEFEKLN